MDQDAPLPPTPTPVCAIGASAGGITALRELFRHLPEDLGFAYVVIMHLAPDHPSALSDILGSATRMPVQQVDDGPELRPNHVYVIAPDRELVIDGDEVMSRPFSAPRGRRAPIDMFFRSVARGRGDGIAVVLSGAGSDGALGVSAIKEAGGVVFVQEPADAEYPMMPRSALAAGVADFVAPIPRLVERIVEVARSKDAVRSLSMDGVNNDLRRIVGFLRARTGHDFSSYKRATVMRRVLRRVQVTRRLSPADYADYLVATPEEAQELFADLLISVTMFFRDPDAFKALADKVLEPMFDQAGDGGLRAWVVGCATGEEAYSLAILLLEEMDRRGMAMPVQVFATDLDEGALGTARDGRYPAAIEADVSEERLRRFFLREGTHYRVKKEVRDIVLFATHSVLKDPPFMRLDLVTCRNLLIYLERNLQRQVCMQFHYGLRPGGYLFLGSAETTDATPEIFFPVDREARLYCARAHASRSLPIVSQVFGEHPPGPAPITRISARAERDRDAATLHAAALEAQAPPSALVDRNSEVLHLSPTVGRFLRPSAGPVTTDLVSLARVELRVDLVSALRRSFDQGEPVLSLPVVVDFESGQRRVLLHVAPSAEHPPAQALVSFLDAGASLPDPQTRSDQEQDEETARLRDALRVSEQHLAQARRDHEVVIQDLRIANEELQSINEEYRSTSEELETSKEELQSMNEELHTVNAELKSKLKNVSTAHSDLQNLISTTEVGTLFLDPELRIRMFTPGLAALFNITDADVGRAITDFTHRLSYDGLRDDAIGVLRELSPVEREIDTQDGHWMMMRVRPYRTVDDRIDGVVVTFVDVTALRRATKDLRESEARFRALVRATNDAVFSMGPDWREMLHLEGGGFLPETTAPSESWMETYIHPDEREMVTKAVQDVVRARGVFQLEHRVRRKDGSYGWTLSRAVPLVDGHGRLTEWFGTLTEISERHANEEQLRQSKDFLALANAASQLGWGAWQFPQGEAEWDARAREIIGLADAENTVTEWLEHIHPDDRQAVVDTMTDCVRSGKPFDLEYRVVHDDGQLRNVRGTGMFPPGQDAWSARGTGLVRDVTEQKRLEETQHLLMGELTHRVKNMLAIVQSIAYQTRSGSEDIGDFIRKFEQRVQALGRAHSLLTDANWRGATLGNLVDEVLAVFERDGEDSGISSGGPRIVLSANATVSLTMAFHELGTNALKYGALSRPEGRVRLNWKVDKETARLRMRWVEEGGPTIVAPTHKGFGSRLLTRGLAHELDGNVVLDFQPSGVVCTIDVPLGKKLQVD